LTNSEKHIINTGRKLSDLPEANFLVTNQSSNPERTKDLYLTKWCAYTTYLTF